MIYQLATRTFFTDWCYTNAKKSDGNELCDLLVVFDGKALIWQIKDLKTEENGRYKDAEVEKNVRQLGGAREAVRPEEPSHAFKPEARVASSSWKKRDRIARVIRTVASTRSV